MEPLELGYGVTLRFTSWKDTERVGYIQSHHRPDNGTPCESGGLFDLPGVAEAFPDRNRWHVESWDPLTLSPSLLCTACGSHGFIREGRWVPA